MIKTIVSVMLAVTAISSQSEKDISKDFAAITSVTEDQLEGALYYDLKESAYAFVECEEMYGVNSILLSSLAALESGWGRSELAINQNNLFGWKNDSGEYATFSSKEECIYHVASCLSENYLSEDGTYYSGGTGIENVANFYSPSEEWSFLLEDVVEGVIERCDLDEEQKKQNAGTVQEGIFRCLGTSAHCRVEFSELNS